MSNVWQVLAEGERQLWNGVPFESVGPIRFGMNHEEIVDATAGDFVCLMEPYRSPKGALRAELANARLQADRPAVILYYSDSGRVSCIAINALRGPQVNIDGMMLVGRIPSEIEAEFGEYAVRTGGGLRYSLGADPAAKSLGVVLRVQRAGDIMLSRPVFVGQDWAETFWDSSESWIPMEEWIELYR